VSYQLRFAVAAGASAPAARRSARPRVARRRALEAAWRRASRSARARGCCPATRAAAHQPDARLSDRTPLRSSTSSCPASPQIDEGVRAGPVQRRGTTRRTGRGEVAARQIAPRRRRRALRFSPTSLSRRSRSAGPPRLEARRCRSSRSATPAVPIPPERSSAAAARAAPADPSFTASTRPSWDSTNLHDNDTTSTRPTTARDLVVHSATSFAHLLLGAILGCGRSHSGTRGRAAPASRSAAPKDPAVREPSAGRRSGERDLRDVALRKRSRSGARPPHPVHRRTWTASWPQARSLPRRCTRASALDLAARWIEHLGLRARLVRIRACASLRRSVRRRSLASCGAVRSIRPRSSIPIPSCGRRCLGLDAEMAPSICGRFRGCPRRLRPAGESVRGPAHPARHLGARARDRLPAPGCTSRAPDRATDRRRRLRATLGCAPHWRARAASPRPDATGRSHRRGSPTLRPGWSRRIPQRGRRAGAAASRRAPPGRRSVSGRARKLPVAPSRSPATVESLYGSSTEVRDRWALRRRSVQRRPPSSTSPSA